MLSFVGGGGTRPRPPGLEFRLHPPVTATSRLLTFSGEGVSGAFHAVQGDVVAVPTRAELPGGPLDRPGADADPRRRAVLHGPGRRAEGARALRLGSALVDDTAGAHSVLSSRVASTPVRRKQALLEGATVRDAPTSSTDGLLQCVVALRTFRRRDPDRAAFTARRRIPTNRPGARGFRQAAFNVSATATWQDAAPGRLAASPGAREMARGARALVAWGGYVNPHAAGRADRSRAGCSAPSVRALPGSQAAPRTRPTTCGATRTFRRARGRGGLISAWSSARRRSRKRLSASEWTSSSARS